MKNLMIILMSFFTLVGCNAQDKKIEYSKNKTSEEIVKPKVDYKVNKEYDENGNLIKLDSTYTYYYSNIDKDAMIKDSIFKKFNTRFDMKDPFGKNLFDNFFKEDNFNELDFFKDDFFRGNSKRNQEIFDNMMRKMDSLKNQFFINEFPLEEKKKE